MIDLGIILVTFVAVVFSLMAFIGAPYLPTRYKWAKQILTRIKLKEKDFLVDLGSGDGVILALAAKSGAKVLGYELNPFLVFLSRLRLLRYKKRAQVEMHNFWKVNLPKETTIIYVFSVERDKKKLEDYLKNQRQIIGHKITVISFGLPLEIGKEIDQIGAASLYSI